MDKASRPQPANPFSFIESTWNMLLTSVAFITGIIGSFWVSLPYDSESSQFKIITHFAQFEVAVITAVMVMVCMKSRDKKVDTMFWGRIAFGSLFFSIVAFFGYLLLFDMFVVTPPPNIGKKVLVTGYAAIDEDVESFINKYRDTHKEEISKWELLNNAGWNPWKIWTRKSILTVRFGLSGLYVILTPLFAITIVAVAQMIKCDLSRK